MQTGILAAVAVVFSVGAMGVWAADAPVAAPTAKLIVSYDAAKGATPQNPKEQGWQELNGCKLKAEGKPLPKDKDNPPAWLVIDDDADGDEDMYYGNSLPDEAMKTAYEDGFTMRWRLKIVDERRPNRAVSAEACVRSDKRLLRFCFFLGRDGKNVSVQTILSTEADGMPTASLAIPNSGGWHTWTFIFDGAKKDSKGTLYVDDKVILTGKFGWEDPGDTVCFGSKASGRNSGQWNLVEFYTGKLGTTPSPDVTR